MYEFRITNKKLNVTIDKKFMDNSVYVTNYTGEALKGFVLNENYVKELFDNYIKEYEKIKGNWFLISEEDEQFKNLNWYRENGFSIEAADKYQNKFNSFKKELKRNNLI